MSKKKPVAVKPQETLVQQLQQKQKLKMEWEVTRVKRRAKRRVIDPVIRTLGCWASTRGIKLPAKCLAIPQIGCDVTGGAAPDSGKRNATAPHQRKRARGNTTSDENGRQDGGGNWSGENDVGEEECAPSEDERDDEHHDEVGKAEEDDKVCDLTETRGRGSRRVRAKKVAVAKTTTIGAVDQLANATQCRRPGAEASGETLTIRDVGAGTVGGTAGAADGDAGDVGQCDKAGAQRAGGCRRRADELCILSVDFGVVLTFAILLLSVTSLHIVQWQSVRLSGGAVKCQEAALALITYLSGFLEGPPDFDVILLEDQPPKKATRPRDLSYATYGALQTMYRSVPSSHPRHADRKGMPHIAFVHAQLKINLCYLMGVESGKSQTEHYNHNKDISTVGCKHLLMHLAPHCTWATACLRWLLNQTKMDDYADALLQALAWYHNRPGCRLPFDIVPLNSFTTVAPPSAATVARRLKRPPGAPPPKPKVPLAVTLGKRNAKLKIKEATGRLSSADF